MTCKSVAHPSHYVFVYLYAGHYVQKHTVKNSIESFTEIQKDNINSLSLKLFFGFWLANSNRKTGGAAAISPSSLLRPLHNSLSPLSLFLA